MAQDKIVTRTKSGDIVTINDAYAGLPVESLKASIEPIQDLHGYDKPWSGGNGKNKWNGTFVNASFAELGSFTSTCYAGNNAMPIKVGTVYTASTNGTLSGIRYVFLDADKNAIGDFVNASSTDSAPTNAVYLRWRLRDEATASGLYQIEEGSTATSFEPYSNICPISGRTEVVTSRMGKNLLEMPFEHYTATASKDNCFHLPRGTYTFSFDSTTETSWRFILRLYDADGNEITSGSPAGAAMPYRASVHGFSNGVNTTYKSFSFTLESDAYVRVLFWGGSTTASSVFDDTQLEVGSTATDYEAFDGTSYTTDLGRTVYGGTLDVVSGVLTVDRASVDLGSLTWYRTAGDDIYIFTSTSLSTKAKGVTNIIADNLATTNKTSWTSAKPDGSICGSASSSTVVVRADAYTDAQTFKLAMGGHYACYELATPQTIQLTPQEVELLKGTNNLWCDAGDIEVTYITNQSVFPLKIYSGTSVAGLELLPSPVELNPTFEMIWSENTGRAQSGSNQAKMIGDVVAEKKTYNIKWGVITDAEMMQIKTKLPTGFFYFGMGTTISEAKRVATKYYRSEIAGNYLPIGNNIFWKDVAVSVIEQ